MADKALEWEELEAAIRQAAEAGRSSLSSGDFDNRPLNQFVKAKLLQGGFVVKVFRNGWKLSW